MQLFSCPFPVSAILRIVVPVMIPVVISGEIGIIAIFMYIYNRFRGMPFEPEQKVSWGMKWAFMSIYI